MKIEIDTEFLITYPITTKELVFYGVLKELCKENEQCEYSNERLSALMNVSKTSITIWLKHLKEANLINIQFVYIGTTKGIEKRIITLSQTKTLSEYIDEIMAKKRG